MENAKIDHCILLANYVIVFVTTELCMAKGTLSIESNGKKLVAAKVLDVSSINTRLFIFEASSYLSSSGSRLTATFLNEHKKLFAKEDNITISTVLQPGCEPYVGKLLEALANNISLPSSVSFALEALSAGEEEKKYAIDNACYHNGYLVITGWIENAAKYELNIFSEDMSSCVEADRFFFHSRPDVTEALSSEDVPIVTSQHGFVCVSAKKLNFCNSNFKIILKTDQKILYVGSFKIVEQPKRPIITAIYQIQSNGSLLDKSFINDVIRPLLKIETGNIGFKTATVSSTPASAMLSIIIPFYKEWFFIRALSRLHNQFPDFVEWIYVCDDPITAKEVSRYLFLRTDEVRRNIRVVVNHENYGYGISNNIGVKHAKARTLLFMNSDIWIDGAAPILEALKLIKSGVFGIIGFRLLFEDGSLQHDGIAFKRSAFFGNLFVADHQSKGLPPVPSHNHLQEVDAVTGALMMVDRHTFEKVGGFDKNYIRGDFEDVDLCLEFRKIGKRVGISRSTGNFHFERQSIRTISSIDYRTLVTLTNCVYFNGKWSEYLNTGKLEFWQ